MNWKKYIKKFVNLAVEPIRRNANFFAFMYILGILCAIVTLAKNQELYDNLYLELFFDIYTVCIVLAFIPKKIRFWVRGVLYFILYATAIADVYCFVNFGATLNPSMLGQGVFYLTDGLARLPTSIVSSTLVRRSTLLC